jgi:hypothetical protein
MTRINRLRPAALAVFVGVLSSASTSTQGQEELDRTPTDCIVEGQINKDTAVDSRTILFFLKGNKVFRNQLPQSCPVLEPGETRLVYHYRTQPRSVKLTRLCDTDSITVERKGTTACRLGQFVPITAAEAEALVPKPAGAAAAQPAPAQ